MTSIWDYYPTSQVVLEKNGMNDKWAWLAFSAPPEEGKMTQSLNIFWATYENGHTG